MFYFRLALALGCTVRELLARIDSAELTEWRAYAALEPFGEVVADVRHGIQVATLANVNRNAEKVPEPYVPDDFIPWARSKRKAGPTLLDNPQAQTDLVKKTLFGGLLRRGKK